MRISDWSSDVCSSDLVEVDVRVERAHARRVEFDARFEQARRLARHDHADVDELLALDPRYRADHRVVIDGRGRSEERRVGKECVSTCRFRWSPSHLKNNTTDHANQN